MLIIGWSKTPHFASTRGSANPEGAEIGGGATAVADASASKSGIANATANVNGGAASPVFFSGPGAADRRSSRSQWRIGTCSSDRRERQSFRCGFFGNSLLGGAATANASATNGGSAVAQATGGDAGASGVGFLVRGGAATANASATNAGSAVALGSP